MQPASDILIVGGGMVGLTLALALAQRTSLSITILEAHPPLPPEPSVTYHHRVSAMSLSSQRVFQTLGVWEGMQRRRVSALTSIEVGESASQANIRFDSSEIAESRLGYIIENNVMLLALREKIATYPQIQFVGPQVATKTSFLTAWHVSDERVRVSTHDGREFSAALAVAADGANSWLREQAGIALKVTSYEQEAIVATVRTALLHQCTARQVFLPSGPLAFLPLTPADTSSIVWSLPTQEAKRLLAVEESAFKAELSQVAPHGLGDVVEVSPRFSFPLKKQEAAHYIKARIALVGDAAHTIHPLAGQGINMGLLDAASLADVIVTAVHQRRDFSSYATLRRYERWRKADNQALLYGVDGIKAFFASSQSSVQSIRALGLTMTNQWPLLKNIFTRHAVGNRAHLPSLAT